MLLCGLLNYCCVDHPNGHNPLSDYSFEYLFLEKRLKPEPCSNTTNLKSIWGGFLTDQSPNPYPPADPTRSEDRLLHARILSGDRAALDTLIGNHCARTIHYHIWKFNFKPEEYSADELASDLCLQLCEDNFRAFRTWEGRSSLKTWLNPFISHLCMKKLEELKRLQNYVAIEERLLPTEGTKYLTPGLLRLELVKVIAALKSEQERLLIIYHILEERDIKEVADRLRITRGHADVLKHRAILHLREEFKKRGLIPND